MKCAQGPFGRLAAVCGVVVALGGCVQAPPQLYAWEAFPLRQFETLLGEEKSPERQIQLLEAHFERAWLTRRALPPGFRAHLGMQYLAVGQIASARRWLQLEAVAFPESRSYINSLLARIDGPPPPAKTPHSGNPA
jgi:hypothetical protein